MSSQSKINSENIKAKTPSHSRMGTFVFLVVNFWESKVLKPTFSIKKTHLSFDTPFHKWIESHWIFQHGNFWKSLNKCCENFVNATRWLSTLWIKRAINHFRCCREGKDWTLFNHKSIIYEYKYILILGFKELTSIKDQKQLF